MRINSQTYSKDEFYQAQTSLIRFKTPEISFLDLLKPTNSFSPLIKLQELAVSLSTAVDSTAVEGELKLFANIFRSSLRRQVYPIMLRLENANSDETYMTCKKEIEELFAQMDAVLLKYEEVKAQFLTYPHWQNSQYIFEYVEDILSIFINTAAARLLKKVRSKHHPSLQDVDKQITVILLEEKRNREEHLKEPSQLSKDVMHNEAILFQSGMLNKFMLDALLLKTDRQVIVEKYQGWIGSFAAGVAMIIYLSLFIWQGSLFVINSLPFVIFWVFIYVLKDRLKEELKNLSFKHVFRWFPDYTTEILSPSGDESLGKMHDSFGFIKESQVPNDIWTQRNKGFQTYLDMIKLPEQVIYYKKKIDLHANHTAKRLAALNIIFRFDIHKFMAKASNAYQPYTTIDSETLDLISTQLPKVYHVNIVLKNSYLKPDLSPFVELKKFRVVVDKEGIKRIESITEYPH